MTDTTDKTPLEKMERLRDLLIKEKALGGRDWIEEARDLYAELEDLIMEIDPIDPYDLEFIRGEPIKCKTHVFAGHFTGSTVRRGEADMQLRKVIAKLRGRNVEIKPSGGKQSVEQVVKLLNNFRACCQYCPVPQSEKDVQDILWTILRGSFNSLIREETTFKFGTKSYRPDFAVPEVHALIEVKFIGSKTPPKDIQEEVLSDIQPYLKAMDGYRTVVIFIYDHANKIKDDLKLVSDLERIEGIGKVIVAHSIA